MSTATNEFTQIILPSEKRGDKDKHKHASDEAITKIQNVSVSSEMSTAFNELTQIVLPSEKPGEEDKHKPSIKFKTTVFPLK